MIGEGIREEVLRALVEQHLVRECLVARVNGGPDWGLSIRLGGSGARWVPVCSRRKKVRTWVSCHWGHAITSRLIDCLFTLIKTQRRTLKKGN